MNTFKVSIGGGKSVLEPMDEKEVDATGPERAAKSAARSKMSSKPAKVTYVAAKLEQIDELNRRIQSFRPLSEELLRQVKEYFRIGLTYSSNARDRRQTFVSRCDLKGRTTSTVSFHQLHGLRVGQGLPAAAEACGLESKLPAEHLSRRAFHHHGLADARPADRGLATEFDQTPLAVASLRPPMRRRCLEAQGDHAPRPVGSYRALRCGQTPHWCAWGIWDVFRSLARATRRSRRAPGGRGHRQRTPRGDCPCRPRKTGAPGPRPGSSRLRAENRHERGAPYRPRPDESSTTSTTIIPPKVSIR